MTSPSRRAVSTSTSTGASSTPRLCVSERYTTDEIQDLIADLDDELLDAIGLERDDFVVHVHQGREVGVFSGSAYEEGEEPGSEN